MKAITIIQPWATLIAIGEKRFETRSWPTKHRGEIAIHAGKKIDKEACEAEPIRSVLAKYGYTADNLPTGAVVALCNLSDCLSITNCGGKIYGVDADSLRYEIDSIPEIKGNELAFGWYETGRFAWEMTEVQRLTTPIPAKGQQGLWNWDSEGHGGTGGV